MNQPLTTRRYDVDSLRVIAFILLIFYHIGMYYVADWGWHVKSQYQSSNLQYPMLLLNQWRMPLIFFISGFALCMVEPKIRAAQLIKIRFLRVLIPLLIGMYLIVPPQAFFEAKANYNFAGGYLEFWLAYINPNTQLLPQMHHSELGLLTWNHLWYLAYLWFYSLAYLLLKPVISRLGARFANTRQTFVWLIILPIATLSLYGLWLKPHFPRTNALFDDWYNHAVYFSIFLFGYFAAKSERYWNTIIRWRWWFFGAAVITFTGYMLVDRGNLIVPDTKVWSLVIQVWVYSNLWMWLLSVVGFSGAHLNKPSPTLSYLNEAILPWYILHQTVTILIAAWANHLSLGPLLEPLTLVIGTFTICALAYEVIRRVAALRFMFGMKLKPVNRYADMRTNLPGRADNT